MKQTVLNCSSVLALILIFSVKSFGQFSPQLIGEDVNVDSLLDHLRSTLGNQHAGVLIELNGNCDVENPEIITVESINWFEPRKSSDQLFDVQSALKGNRRLSIARSASGVITIRDLRLSQDFSRTMVKSFTLSRQEQYSPDSAITGLLNTDEVRGKLGELRMRMVPIILGLRHGNSVDEAHLSHRYKNMSVTDFFGAVSAKFGGFVVYEECRNAQGQRTFDVQYYK